MVIALKKIMDEKKITVPELVEKTGLTKNMIWAYQSGRNNPDPETLCALADALDVSLDMLIRGKEKDRSEERSMESAIKRYENYSLSDLSELGALIQYLRYRKERERQQEQASSDTP